MTSGGEPSALGKGPAPRKPSLAGYVLAVSAIGFVLLMFPVAFYALDYPMPADVVDVECQETPSGAVVRTVFVDFNKETGVAIPDTTCSHLAEGPNAVQFVRSKRVLLFTEEGHCVFDSETGTDCSHDYDEWKGIGGWDKFTGHGKHR